MHTSSQTTGLGQDDPGDTFEFVVEDKQSMQKANTIGCNAVIYYIAKQISDKLVSSQLLAGNLNVVKINQSELGSRDALQLMGARRFLPSLAGRKEGYSMDLALLLGEMCDFVYFTPYWWESPQLTAQTSDPEHFSTKVKLYSGYLQLEEKWQEAKVPSPWNVIPVHVSRDLSLRSCFASRDRWIKGGMIHDSETDTEAIILQSEMKREIYILFRGTEKARDKLIDIRFMKSRNPYGPGNFHSGFLNAYLSVAPMVEEAVYHLWQSDKFDNIVR
eukprot:c3448_g1_i1.p1 GENE.c3448_g1_i1~~c3448_g1_i1.p1  ORF type:complete len:274 (+),score=47.67 c3448_g1_i1:84-905(+)